MNRIKKFLKYNRLTKGLYTYLQKQREAWKKWKKIRCQSRFTDRSNGSKILCIVLAGYKEYLYDVIFPRIKNSLLPDMDVCVITSGLYSDVIASLCEKNGWSYLSTKQNNVSLVQNVAIHLHPKAEYIFKLDEDIFVPINYFANMLNAYSHAEKGCYCPGVLAPILPVNGYGHYRILDKLGLLEIYKERFEEPKYKTGMERLVEKSAEVAKFFWGEDGFVPSIDELNRRFQMESLEERPCPIRFSIGAILFKRELWDEMGWFDINLGGVMEWGWMRYSCVNFVC